MAEQTKLWAALVKAQKQAGLLDKDARNEYSNYNYTSSETLIIEAKECLAAQGLAVVPVSHELEITGAADAPATLKRTFKLIHESGESVDMSHEWAVVPSRGRPMDRAVAAADTSGMGYFLRGLLQFGRVEPGTEMDDEEHDAAEARTAAKPKKKAAPKDAEPVSLAERGLIEQTLRSAKDRDDLTTHWKSYHNQLKAPSDLGWLDKLAAQVADDKGFSKGEK